MKLLATRGVMIEGQHCEPGDLVEVSNESLARALLAGGKVVPAGSVDRSVGITDEPAPVKKTTRKRAVKKAD